MARKRSAEFESVAANALMCGITVSNLADEREVEEQWTFACKGSGRQLLHYHPRTGAWMARSGSSGIVSNGTEALVLAVQERDRK